MAAGLLRRVVRWTVAFALLPLNIGVTWALWDLTRTTAGLLNFWIPVLAGVAIWLLLFSQLPKPMWIYVFGHELTHALCAWCFGGKVTSFKVSKKGGEVRVTKTNAFISLAPYFLPLYAVIWSVAIGLASLGGASHGWLMPLYYCGLGITYGFHVTMTAAVLRIRQPDLVGEGFLFSWSIIWLGNVLIPLVALPWLAGSPGVLVSLRNAVWHTGDVIQFASGWLRQR